MDHDTAEKLAARLRRGDPEAVQSVRARVTTIIRFRGYGISNEERKDLEQEVMTQIWQAVNRSSFDPTRGFWGFVEVVTARRCIDWLRTKRNEVELDDSVQETTPSPLGSTLIAERISLARRVVSQLDSPCRELIDLHIVQGKAYREIAEVLGKSEGALRVKMYRCIRRAQQLLIELRGDSPDHRPGIKKLR